MYKRQIQYQAGHSSFAQYVECKFDGSFSQLFDGADSSSFSPFTYCTFRNTQNSTPLFETQSSKLAFHECKFENEKIFDQTPVSIIVSFTDCLFVAVPDFGTAETPLISKMILQKQIWPTPRKENISILKTHPFPTQKHYCRSPLLEPRQTMTLSITHRSSRQRWINAPSTAEALFIFHKDNTPLKAI